MKTIGYIKKTISNIGLAIVSVLTLLFARVIQAQTTWTDADISGSYADPLNWSPNGVPGAATNVLFNTDASVTLTGTTNAAGTITVNNGADAVMNLGPSDVLTISGASFAQALFVEGGGAFGLSGGTLNVAVGQIFVGDLNGNGTLNIAGNLNFDVNDSGSNYAYMVVGRNSNPAGNIVNSGSTTGQGIVNQTSGVVTAGGNFDIGLDNGNGTYNLSGGQLVTGSNSTLFPIYIGFNQDAGDTAGTTQGLLNITGSGTFTLGAGGQLRVGSGNNIAGDGDSATVGANGKIIQNGVDTVVTFNGGGSNGGVWFGSLASAAPGTTITGGSGVYELDAGTLNIDSGIVSFGDSVSTSGTLNQNGGLLDASQAGTSTATIYIGNSGTGVYNLTSGTAIFGNGLTVGNNAGSSGTVNQSGGLLAISGGQLDLAQANSTYNISSGTLQVGGANGITGAGVLNGSGGTIQVIGSDFTTSVDMSLTAATTSTVDTNHFNATFSGILSGSGALTKVGSGTLTLSATSSYSGATTVNGGALYVDGAIDNSNVTVNSGATLGGNGSTGGITVAAGGTFSPGNSPASFSATSLAMNAGGVYKVDIVGGGAPVGGTNYTQTTLSGSGAVLSLNGTPSTGSVLQLSISGALRPGGIGSDANPYVVGASNSSLDNYFILVLGTGTKASAGDEFSMVTDGTNTVSIDYSSLNQFNGEDGLGTFTLDGQEWVISYTGDASDGGTIGGNDVVLTAIPEPGAWAMLAGGFGMLLCWRRLPRRKGKLISS